MSEEKQDGTSFLKIFTGTTLGIVAAIVIILICCSVMCFGIIAISGNRSTPTKVSDSTQTTTSPSATPSTQFYIGDVVSIGNVNVTVNSISDYTSESQYFQPKSGFKYLAVEVTVENIDGTTSGYGNPYNFTLKDADGFTYNDSVFGSKEPTLKSDDIAQGQKTRGFLTYEVPTTQSIFTLTYRPSLFGSSVVINLTSK